MNMYVYVNTKHSACTKKNILNTKYFCIKSDITKREMVQRVRQVLFATPSPLYQLFSPLAYSDTYQPHVMKI